MVFTERPSKCIQSMGAGLFEIVLELFAGLGPGADMDVRGADKPGALLADSC